MSAEEWDQIKRLFSAALALPETERADYLENACGGRNDLLATVEELLVNHSQMATGSGMLAEPAPAALAVGELVANRYRLVRFIARGGMGEVHEVFDERLRVRLALKTLRPELAVDREAMARFERELLITREVSHDSLCRMFDFVEHETARGRLPCLTMELLEGESLAERLARQRPLDRETALLYIRQIGAAMTTLHEQGIVHRDLKPSNVMLAKRRHRPQQAVVTDFGLAKMKNSDTELFQSQFNLQVGAPYFMAPELLRCEDHSVASDVYSFGLVIDEMITTRRAYSAESIQALYFAKLWEDPIPPRDRSVGLPDHWNDVVLGCLERDTRRRFASVAEVVRRLESPVSQHRPYMGRRAVLTAGIGATVASVGAAAVIRSQAPNATVGVFDIENRTAKPFDYLCRGTVAELMRRLSNLGGVKALRLYATRRGELAKKQGFSLDGALEGEPGKMRLIMQLFDNSAGRVLWSKDFGSRLSQPDGGVKVSNVLDLQSEIAAQTIAALEGALGLGFRLRVALRRWQHGSSFAVGSPTSSNTAFDDFLRGQMLLQEGTPASVPAAVESFDRAVAEDPHFALAWAALAQAHLAWMNLNHARSEESGRSARFGAERALEEDGELPEAHAAMGAVRQNEWDWRGALQSFDYALRLKPRFPRVLRWRAGLLLQFARFEEAIQAMEQALEIDPYDRTSASGHGLTLLFAGRVREAIQFLEDAVAGRDLTSARFNLGQAYARQAYLLGNSGSAALYAKALQQAEIVARSESKRPRLSTQMFALTYSLCTPPTAALPYVRELEEDVFQNGGSPVRLAWIYAIQKETDKALELLERALLARDASLYYIRVNPFLENLRKQQRFEAIVAAMQLT
jgi:tetratricopeptide (TPR) repeat protein